jgi:hypothetical protein
MIGPRRGPLGPFRPSPIAEVTRLFNDLIGPQWVADGFGPPASDLLLASRFKGPRGGQSVVVLNNGSQAQQVQVELKQDARFFAVDWNHDGQGTRRPLPRPTVDSQGRAVLGVPPKGLVAVSTLSL